jgi:hypothetical protein
VVRKLARWASLVSDAGVILKDSKIEFDPNHSSSVTLVRGFKEKKQAVRNYTYQKIENKRKVDATKDWS